MARAREIPEINRWWRNASRRSRPRLDMEEQMYEREVEDVKEVYRAEIGAQTSELEKSTHNVFETQS